MRTQVSIGIDPGLSGAVAAISAGSLEVLDIMDTPIITSEGKRLYDIGGMSSAIRHMSLFGGADAVQGVWFNPDSLAVRTRHKQAGFDEFPAYTGGRW